jgi:hypothetical protein
MLDSDSETTISYIMHTANRPVEVMRATQQFLEQDYPATSGQIIGHQSRECHFSSSILINAKMA